MSAAQQLRIEAQRYEAGAGRAAAMALQEQKRIKGGSKAEQKYGNSGAKAGQKYGNRSATDRRLPTN